MTPVIASGDDGRFGVLEQPTTPAGLKNLRVERLTPGHGLLLTEFDADLTVGQNSFTDDPERTTWSGRSLQWAVEYHELDAEPTPPVRPHCGNVLLLHQYILNPNAGAGKAALSAWLGRSGRDAGRPIVFQQASTDRPVEDGFFRRVRVLAAGPCSTAT